RDRHGRLALDEPRRTALLCRAEVDPRRVLPGSADRRRLALGRVHGHSTAQDESRAADCGAAPLHGLFHDLHRAVRRHRRRPGQLHHFRLDRARQDRARPVRPRQGGGAVAGLQPDHPDRLLGVLHRHDQCWRRAQAAGEAGGGDGAYPRGRAQARSCNVAQGGCRMSYSIPGRRLILALFLVFLLLPIYWLVNMSFKTNNEIVSTMTLWPHTPTLQHYRRIFTDQSWYSGYINSLEYVVINTIISISVA